MLVLNLRLSTSLNPHHNTFQRELDHEELQFTYLGICPCVTDGCGRCGLRPREQGVIRTCARPCEGHESSREAAALLNRVKETLKAAWVT